MGISLPKIVTIGQLAVMLATFEAIDAGSKTPADKYAKAAVALQVAAAFNSIATGDVAGAVTTLQTELLAKVTDPGEAAVVNVVFNAATPFLMTAAQAAGSLPLVNATWQGAAGEISTAITTVASAYPAPVAS